jgi:MFS family permease
VVRSDASSASNHEPAEAFGYSNYRRFFVGQALSNVGTWFQMIAQSLLVLKITGRASSLGESMAIQSLPILLLGPFIGPFIDRANLRRILVVISSGAAVEAFALATLVETHHVTIYWIFGLSFALGFCLVFLQPAIATLLSELVAPPAIPSAVSLNAVQNATGRLAGPAAAGLLYAWRGPGTCFIVNGISYLIVVVAVLSLRRERLYVRPTSNRSARQVFDGLSYAWRSPLHRGQLIAAVVIGCLAFNYPIFYSAMTQLVLHSGAASFGIAETINAGFAVLGGLVLSRRLRHPTRRTFVLGCALLGTSLLVTALAPDIIAFYLDMVLFGLCVVTYGTVNQTLFQLNTPRDRLGSVMSLLSYANQGTTPIGSLLIGGVISWAGARAGLAVGASSALGAALVLGAGLRRAARRAEPQPAGD